MGLDVWFREDVIRTLSMVPILRGNLTSDELIILAAICAGFGVRLAEVLPPEQAVMVLPERARSLPR